MYDQPYQSVTDSFQLWIKFRFTSDEMIVLISPSRVPQGEIDILKELGVEPVHNYYFVIKSNWSKDPK